MTSPVIQTKNQYPPSNSQRGLLFGLTLALFVLSCTLPAMRLENGNPWDGWDMLFFGFLGIFEGQFAWYANIPFVVSLVFVLLGWWRLLLILSAFQILIALDMLLFPGTELILDEGGVNKSRVAAFLPGAWVWLGTICLPVFIAGWGLQKRFFHNT